MHTGFQAAFNEEPRMSRTIVVYMSPWCGNSLDTQRALGEWGVAATYINIKEDRTAAARLREWVGFESVPTVVIAEGDSLVPYEPPQPLTSGMSPRGVDRGSIITEAARPQLLAWLTKNGFVAK
jgi:glutaredoxin